VTPFGILTESFALVQTFLYLSNFNREKYLAWLHQIYLPYIQNMLLFYQQHFDFCVNHRHIDRDRSTFID